MAVDVGNILVGPAQFFTAPVGTALPELDDLDGAKTISAPGGSWAGVGATSEDAHVTYQPKFDDITINESNCVVKKVLVSEEASAGVVLMESDLAAWKKAIAAAGLTNVAAGAAQTGQDILKVGDGAVAEVALLILGVSPEGGSRVVHVHRAVATGKPKFSWAKKHKGVPVDYEVIADMTKSAGERLFEIIDITAVETGGGGGGT